jgi:hypothetical protein
MAIYHLTVKHGARAEGQSAMAKLSYIARLDKYADRDDLAHIESGHLPPWAPNALALWDAVDSYSRANARLFTEIEAALPRELSREQLIALVREFVDRITTFRDGHVPYTYGMHIKDGNPHFHLMLSTRLEDGVDRTEAAGKAKIGLAEQWFKRTNKKASEKGGAVAWSERTDKDWMEQTRSLFAQLTNEALTKANSTERVDHRSHARRGLTTVPTQHAGWGPRRREEVQEYNARARAANEEMLAAEHQVQALRKQRAKELEAEQLARDAIRASRAKASLTLLFEKEAGDLQREHAGTVGPTGGTQRLRHPSPDLLPSFVAKKGHHGIMYIRMPADTLALIDTGRRIKLKECEPASTRAALMLAASRWQEFEVTCAPEHQAAWKSEAAALGLVGRLQFARNGGGTHQGGGHNTHRSRKPRPRA